MSGGAAPGRLVVWAALCAGPIAYLGITLGGVIPPYPGGVPAPLLPVLAAAAMVVTIVSRVLWARLVSESEAWSERGVSPPAGVDPVLPRAVVVWALDESVAVLGFVLAWLGATLLVCAPFYGVALLLLALDHPGRLS